MRMWKFLLAMTFFIVVGGIYTASSLNCPSLFEKIACGLYVIFWASVGTIFTYQAVTRISRYF
jgi:hypothetical protein